jgi:hypothetical protein
LIDTVKKWHDSDPGLCPNPFITALLPGPGTYACKFEFAEKFERPPSAKLKPKKNAAIPRRVILPETLDILDSPAQKQAAGEAQRDFVVHRPLRVRRYQTSA